MLSLTLNLTVIKVDMMSKYWFITYSYKAPYQGHLENAVLDEHPFVFISKSGNKSLRILFYKEITKDEYEDWINNKLGM